MMEAASTSESSVFYQATRRNNPEDSHLNSFVCIKLWCSHLGGWDTRQIPVVTFELHAECNFGSARPQSCGVQVLGGGALVSFFLALGEDEWLASRCGCFVLGIVWVWGRVGPRASLDVVAKRTSCLCRESNSVFELAAGLWLLIPFVVLACIVCGPCHEFKTRSCDSGFAWKLDTKGEDRVSPLGRHLHDREVGRRVEEHVSLLFLLLRRFDKPGMSKCRATALGVRFVFVQFG
jgi:hypothetical protein